MFKRIVLAFDGSEDSWLALNYARGLAECYGSKLLMVHAYPQTSDLHGYGDYEKLVSKRKAEGQEILNSAGAKLKDASIEVEEDLLEGPAAEAILKVAETRRADLIVMGTRGRGAFEGLLFGSVSTKLTQYAPCPVMVVR